MRIDDAQPLCDFNVSELPALGITQELAAIGYGVQRKSLDERGIRCSALQRSGRFDIYAATDPAERLLAVIRNDGGSFPTPW